MNIDQNLIEKLQRLSMLKISDKQEKKTIKALQDVLNFTSNLDSLDLSHIKEIHFNPAQGYTKLRDDNTQDKENLSKSILENAPLSQDNFFVVPNIIE